MLVTVVQAHARRAVMGNCDGNRRGTQFDKVEMTDARFGRRHERGAL